MSSEKDTKAQGIHIYFSPLFLSQAKKKKKLCFNIYKTKNNGCA